MSDIFLSYSRDDREFAERLSRALNTLGWSVWWDPALRAGEEWNARLDEELGAARCVLVMWSTTSVVKAWVKKEAATGLKSKRLVPVTIEADVTIPPEFSRVQAGSLAGWHGRASESSFQSLVDALTAHLGDAPMSARRRRTTFAEDSLQKERPASVKQLDLPKSGVYFPSPQDWRDEILYLLIPDRFSDGREKDRPLVNRHAVLTGKAGAHLVSPYIWAASGRERWQGGTLEGLISQLDYLKELGVTTVWLWPVWKQRAAADTFHGYAIQDFLDVDPRLGTREQLVDLVATAHMLDMRVILSGHIHHSGTNWLYRDELESRSVPPYTPGRHSFGAWLGSDEQPISEIREPDDGVWPVELQEPECYMRAGSGRIGILPEDGDRRDVEPLRTDFFTLRTFDPDKSLHILIECHRYWLALTDCDGFHLDLAMLEAPDALRSFCRSVRQYASRLGKANFFVSGEVFGTSERLADYYAAIARSRYDSLSAVLDNGPMRVMLQAVAKGLAPGSSWFSGYGEAGGELGPYRDYGSRHISILDDPDNVFGTKRRFCSDPLAGNQLAVAMALQLFSLGIPCIYYGTEQAFGTIRHDGEAVPGSTQDDVFLREAMFGPEHPRRAGRKGLAVPPQGLDSRQPGFGPFGTAGAHSFDRKNQSFRLVAALVDLRRRIAALHAGEQYQRKLSILGGQFDFPAAGEIVAWSRILGDQEVLCITNPNPTEPRGGRINVDASLNPVGASMSVLLSTSSFESAGEGNLYVPGTAIPVLRSGPVACVDVLLAPGAVFVLSNVT